MSIFKKLGLADNYGITAFAVILMFASGFALLVFGCFWMDATSCGQYGDATGRDTEYRVPAGCFVEYGGHFIPQDEFNARAITHEAIKP